MFILFFSRPTDPPSQETGRWETKHFYTSLDFSVLSRDIFLEMIVIITFRATDVIQVAGYVHRLAKDENSPKRNPLQDTFGQKRWGVGGGGWGGDLDRLGCRLIMK